MRLKIVSKPTLVFIVAPSGLILFLSLLFYSIPQAPTQGGSASIIENADALPTQEQARFGLPKRLTIPKINIDAPIVYVGIAPDGTMDVPKGPDEVAWFEPGKRPGENGTAVISGHYGWWENLKKESVFARLHALRKGDTIYIEDERGEIISFVVRESRRYDPKADASLVFGSYDGKSHLNLITCEGVWDRVSKTYSKRLVVFADKE